MTNCPPAGTAIAFTDPADRVVALIFVTTGHLVDSDFRVTSS